MGETRCLTQKRAKVHADVLAALAQREGDSRLYLTRLTAEEGHGCRKSPGRR